MKQLALIAIFVLAGCETAQGPSAPTPPRPRPSTRPEPKVVPLRQAMYADQMAIMVGAKPRDTDADGYPDMIDVTALLMKGRRGDLVLVPGSFEFELQPLQQSTDQPWRVWAFDEEQTAAAAGPTVFDLPGYSFTLDLRATGGDRMPATAANVTGRFQAQAGGPVLEATPDQRIVQIGKGPSSP